VASPQPITAGMPSSRAMIAAWHVRPPRLVTIAEASFITGSQLGSVMSVTSTSPVLTIDIFDASFTTRTGAGADLLSDGPAADQQRSRSLEPELFLAAAGRRLFPTRTHRLRPGLQHVDGCRSAPSLPHSISIGRP
jgi:hypothetical protein